MIEEQNLIERKGSLSNVVNFTYSIELVESNKSNSI